ncbi:hypothetical protein [Rhodobacteraceae bacterium DSL-40]|uniref:hypothetical protein n=1 Tax=Amaricoccus sp. B4 TaxID=3368557 RepID=UPI0013A6F22B
MQDVISDVPGVKPYPTQIPSKWARCVSGDAEENHAGLPARPTTLYPLTPVLHPAQSAAAAAANPTESFMTFSCDIARQWALAKRPQLGLRNR